MPILDKIELELNSKINEWINVRNTINRNLHTVEHQVKWKKRFKSKLMLSYFIASLARFFFFFWFYSVYTQLIISFIWY